MRAHTFRCISRACNSRIVRNTETDGEEVRRVKSELLDLTRGTLSRNLQYRYIVVRPKMVIRLEYLCAPYHTHTITRVCVHGTLVK